jgi:hypothetical protein
VVTLTVGGNDLLGAYGDTTRARAAVRTVIVCVGQVLTRLARLMNSTDDPIILGTVYDPSDGHADGAARLGLSPWPEVLDVLAELNDGLRAVAGQHRARIAEIHDRFLGHGLAIGNPAQPEPRPRNRGLWYCNILEPNAWGADAVRASFWQALQQPG